MRLLNNILYLDFQEMVSCGISEGYLKKAKSVGASCWSFLNDPEDNRRVLIQYETLKDKYKAMVQAKYGNPYSYIAATEIKKHLQSKPEDVDFINSYRLPNGYLPEDHRTQYITALKFLHLLQRFDTKTVRGLGFDTMRTFNDGVIAIIRAEGVKLPTAYCKLREKVREYEQNGPECVISKHYGNKKAQKLGDLQIKYITQLYGQHHQLGFEAVALFYNQVAQEKGWPTVTSAAVSWHLKKPEITRQVIGPRKGVNEYRNANDFVISRKRPSTPNMLWVGDGTPYELYYQQVTIGKNGHQLTSHWNRKYVYVVIDAFNDAIMGYAIGYSETADLARQAWKNACVWRGVLPMQVKTDRFSISQLKALYSKIALNSDFYTPSAVGNARDKVIEPMFGRIFKQITRFHDNFSGLNIRAKEQPNRDYLDKIKHSFPDEQGVITQIHHDFALWNKKKLAEWGEADQSKGRILTDELRLEIFGLKHSYTNRLTNKGLEVTLEGVTRKYMLLDHSFGDTIGTEYQVVYDPDDLSKVLAVGPDGRLKFLVPELEAIPMAFGDMKEGDRMRLNRLLDYKKESQQRDIERFAQGKQLIESEGLLKAGFTYKGTNKTALNEAAAVLKRISPGREDKPFTGDVYDELEEVPVAEKKQIKDAYDD